MLYNSSKSSADLLLLFRGVNGSLTPCVEVDLGNVTNLLNLAPNVITNITPPNFAYLTNQVRTNYSTSYSNAIYTVIGTANSGAQGGLWVTDSSSGTPAGFQSSGYGGIRGVVEGVGADASAQTGNVAGSNFVCTASTDQQAYYYYVTTGQGAQQSTIGTWGGTLGFTDESQPTNSMAFYQFSQLSGLSSPFSPTLIGTFSMNATNGAITFTRASAVVVPTLVPSQIVKVIRAGSTTQVSFTTTNGDNYQLLYKTDLTDASWTTNTSAGVVAGNNATNSLNDSTSDEQRFYRIQSF
jgi:hypothetical protein